MTTSGTRCVALIAGGSGIVGHSVATELKRQGWSVRALARQPVDARDHKNVALSQEVGERQAILLLRLRTSAPRERSSPAMETAGTCAAKAAQSTPPSESYGTVPLRSARVVSSVTWPPLSVVPTLRTRIVPSESSAPMPMINIAFIIRLDPERIIVAPMLIPRPQQLRC